MFFEMLTLYLLIHMLHTSQADLQESKHHCSEDSEDLIMLDRRQSFVPPLVP